jgi:hypothetical protein
MSLEETQTYIRDQLLPFRESYTYRLLPGVLRDMVRVAYESGRVEGFQQGCERGIEAYDSALRVRLEPRAGVEVQS